MCQFRSRSAGARVPVPSVLTWCSWVTGDDAPACHMCGDLLRLDLTLANPDSCSCPSTLLLEHLRLTLGSCASDPGCARLPTLSVACARCATLPDSTMRPSPQISASDLTLTRTEPSYVNPPHPDAKTSLVQLKRSWTRLRGGGCRSSSTSRCLVQPRAVKCWTAA